MTIQAIFREIITERQCQDVLFGGPSSDDAHTSNDWLAILIRCLGLAANDGAIDSPERYRKQLIRVAATAVAAVESHDRRHGKKYVAGEHVTGSGH
jgi:hypothetical protein